MSIGTEQTETVQPPDVEAVADDAASTEVSASLAEEVDAEDEDHAEESVNTPSFEEMKQIAIKGLKKATSKGLTREINIYAVLRDLYGSVE